LILISSILAGVGSLAGQLPATSTQQPATSVVVLGTGNPNPDPDRSGPAVAIIVNGTPYLVDAGAGVMRRAEQAYRAGVTALTRNSIGVVFLTHLHSDHTIGLPDVIHTGWVMGREAPLKVFGPKGTRDMTLHLQEAWRLDVRIRSDGLQPHTANGWQVESKDVWEGVVYQDSNVTVSAFPVPHANWVEALGYKFVTRDRTIVISGDTRPNDAVVEACNGCDVLIHEVYSAEKFLEQEPEWRAYHADSHTSTIELAGLATRARPKLLVLYHQLYWGATDDDLLREVRKGYSGAVVSARDLGIY
jgi:ribonuclease BN (tRNA processing enzyme)